MTVRVSHAERREGGRVWGASAVYVAGGRSASLEQFAAAYAGDGAEMTGLQVLDEFQTVSGPIVLVPLTELGLAYDAMLTQAFAVDPELPLGSGWPPIAIGFDARPKHDPARLEILATDMDSLFRDLSDDPERVSGARGAGLPATAFGQNGGVALASENTDGVGIDAFVLLAGGRRSDLRIGGRSLDGEAGTLDSRGSNVAVVVVDRPASPRGLRALAEVAVEGLQTIGRSERCVALAVSSAAPLTTAGSLRRSLASGELPSRTQFAVVSIVAAASRRALGA